MYTLKKDAAHNFLAAKKNGHTLSLLTLSYTPPLLTYISCQTTYHTSFILLLHPHAIVKTEYRKIEKREKMK